MKLPSILDRFTHGTQRRRRMLTWCGIVVGAWACLWAFQVALFVLEAPHIDRKDPSLWRIPAELTDLSVSSARGKKLSYLGYEFEVPWDDVDEQKTKLIGSWQLIVFHSGKVIFFSGLLPKEDYAFTRAALETTPGDMTLFAPGKAFRRTIPLLLLKSVLVDAHNSDSGIFLIQTKDFRGFQYGKPQSRPREIIDELFADKGRLHFTFRDKSCAGDISQAEINRVIQTTRPVQDRHSGSHPAPP
jgi:hypothetical protein